MSRIIRRGAGKPRWPDYACRLSHIRRMMVGRVENGIRPRQRTTRRLSRIDEDHNQLRFGVAFGGLLGEVIGEDKSTYETYYVK